MAASMPPLGDAATDKVGLLLGPWRAVFEDWRRRLGGGRDLSFVVTSDTAVVVTLRGSDGVTRTNTLTLS